MNVIKTYVYPMYPNHRQETVLNAWIEKGKWIYNYLLQVREKDNYNRKNNPEEYEAFRKRHVLVQGPNAGKFSWERANANIIRDLQIQYPDLKDIPSESLTTVNEQVRQAYESYFNNLKKLEQKKIKAPRGGFKIPSQKYLKDDFSIHYRHDNFLIKINTSTARVFGFPKIASKERTEGLKIKYFRPIEGRVRQQRISRIGNKWFLHIIAEKSISNTFLKKDSAVGIDWGVKKTVATSDGIVKMLPYDELANLFLRKKVLQKRLERKKKGSKNKQKAYDKIAKIDKKMANIRQYHLKMFATELSREYEMIAVENLKVKNMTKSAKGTLEFPGKNIKQKAGLNRVILNSAPYFFKTFLKNKCEENSSILVEVNPAYTSQTCSCCGHVDKDSRQNQSKFECTKCGFIDNADFNAAKNILKKALDRVSSI